MVVRERMVGGGWWAGWWARRVSERRARVWCCQVLARRQTGLAGEAGRAGRPGAARAVEPPGPDLRRRARGPPGARAGVRAQAGRAPKVR